MIEWNTMSFADAVCITPPVALKRGKVYPFVEMAAVVPGVRSVRESEHREFNGGGSRFSPGDTLMARITPCLENGKIARFRPSIETDVGFGSTEFIVIRGRDGITTNDYAYYLTMWPTFRQFAIGQMTGSSGRQRVPTETLAGFEVAIPPLKEQRAIAHILGTLDDKIELNRRMNRTLEEMARAIFKSWFVDFDPVRAKADGRNTGLPAEIAALFPDSFEDSELGEIPKGWDATSFTDNIEVIGGGTPKTSKPEYWDGDIPWFSVVDTPADGEVFVISTKQTVTQSGIDNSSARILPVGTTIISARGTVGNLALVGVPMAMNQSCYGLKDQRGGAGYFLYFATEAVVDTLRQRGHGSVFNTITRDTLHGLRVASPPHEVMAEFERVVQGLMLQILSNQHKSRTLADIRDALLPKLISGELRVPNAERILERAM